MNTYFIIFSIFGILGLIVFAYGVFEWEDGAYILGLIITLIFGILAFIFLFMRCFETLYEGKDADYLIVMSIFLLLFILAFIFSATGPYCDASAIGFILFVICYIFLAVNIFLVTNIINNSIFSENVNISEKVEKESEKSKNNNDKFNNIIINDETWVEYETFEINLQKEANIFYNEDTQKYYFEFTVNDAYSISFNTYEDYFEINEIEDMSIVKIYTVEVEHINGTDVEKTTEYFYKIFIGEEFFKKFIKIE